jgi:hypothetical protein
VGRGRQERVGAAGVAGAEVDGCGLWVGPAAVPTGVYGGRAAPAAGGGAGGGE